MSRPGRIVILGAGPCGLGAAYRLRELGYDDFAIYERTAQAGGLASSVRDELGFVWDYGCHVLYSRSDYFNSVMDKLLAGQWIEQPRDAQVWMHKRLIPYPLQYNVHRLPRHIRRECVLGLAQAATRSAAARQTNFRDWIVNTFGEGIAAHFMRPYNEKIWAHPLEGMDFGWVAERVPRPELTRVLANLIDERDDDAWGPNARFRYPKEGGIGAIWRRTAEAIGSDRIYYGRTAVSIDPKIRQVRFSDGSEEQYEFLVSTLPIDRLVNLASLDELKADARRLSSSNVHIIGVGIKGEMPEQLVGRKWIYFPDPGLPFYRATVLSNFSPLNAPAGHWSLVAEASDTVHRPIGEASIVDGVIDGFFREGIIPAGSNIVSRFHHVAAPGYPTPTLARNGALSILQSALEPLSIYSRGRFGAWRYEIANQDHAFLQGAELTGRLLLGEAEPTFAL